MSGHAKPQAATTVSQSAHVTANPDIGFCHPYGKQPTEGMTQNSEVLQLSENRTPHEQLPRAS